MSNTKQVRINIMESNLAQSYEKLQLGLITYDYYQILKKDVRKAIRELKKTK